MRGGERSDTKIPYVPALDGLRALALVTVLAFHGGFTVVHGGYLPLTAFFVLSGFLITALLLSERARTDGVGLARFWERRIRRLVPAALLGIALVALYLRFGTTVASPTAEGDVISSMAWVTNWRFIVSDQPYAAAFADPSPVQHYWSLAVEEQFYLVLPLLFAGLLAVGRGRRWLFGVVTAALAAGSVLWMAHLHEPGDAPLRAYFGTDTRAAELLIGVLLACLLVTRSGGLRRFSGMPRRTLDIVGVVALVGSVVLWFVMEEYDDRLYEGGLTAIALLAAVVVAACTQPGALVGRLLAQRPLVWIGRLSYGIYLYHWPIFLWLDERQTGLDIAPLFVLRMTVTVALAWCSLRFVEIPIREGRLPGRLGLVSWANASVATTALVVVALSTAGLPSVTLDTGAQEGELPPPPPAAELADRVPATTPTTTVPATVAAPAPTPTEPPPPGALTEPPTSRAGALPRSDPAPAAVPAAAPTTTTAPPLRVMVVGDSLARNIATGLRLWRDSGAPVEVYDASISGCTYSRGGVRHLEVGEWPVPEQCGWWATSAFTTRVAEFRPDVIVSHIGHNEMYDRTHPTWEGRKAPGDPVLDRFVEDDWIGAARAFHAAGVPVIWLNPPCVDTDRFPGRIDNDEAAVRLEHIRRAWLPRVAALVPVQVTDLDGHLCPNGFTDVVDGVPDARPDGFHVSDAAASAMTRQWLGPIVLRAGGR